MGRSGSIAFEYGIDRACASGKFTPGAWMGTVYRCDYPGGKCAGPADCLYAMGQTGTEQNSDADQSETFDSKSATSKSAFCV